MKIVHDHIKDVYQSVAPQIVYDDDFIRVVWQPGHSSFMLVTFGNLINLADGVKFFGDAPAQKLGFSCLGFMAKQPNWFPKECTLRAIANINKFFYGVKEVITYGGSMGGYAAVKYSSALNATSVIAFCPQWSIDKSECDGHNPGFQEHYSSTLSGMGVVPEDVSGDIFLFLILITKMTCSTRAELAEQRQPQNLFMSDLSAT